MSNCFQSMGALNSLGGLSGTWSMARPMPKPQTPVLVTQPAPPPRPLTLSESEGIIAHKPTMDVVTFPAPVVQQQQTTVTDSGGMFDNLPIIPIAIGLIALLLLKK